MVEGGVEGGVKSAGRCNQLHLQPEAGSDNADNSLSRPVDKFRRTSKALYLLNLSRLLPENIIRKPIFGRRVLHVRRAGGL
jgi:hypothetical protein